MQTQELRVDERVETGKGAARALRRSGWVPAVVYGEEGAKACRVKTADLHALLHGLEGEHALINLRVGDGAPSRALIREVQHHPTRGFIQHVDFQRVSATRKIRVQVPVVLTGEPPALKEGGVLEHLVRELLVECLPGNLPEHIVVDIAALGLGDSIHVRDLPLESVNVLADASTVIAVMSRPTVFKEATPAADTAAAAAGATPAEGAAPAADAAKAGGEKAGDKGGGDKKEAAPKKEKK